MVSLCAAVIDLENLKNFFYHPCTNRKIFVFFDTGHMEKLMRNLLDDVDVYLDNNAIPATWNDIRNLCAFQEEIGIKIANKLTDTHVNFNNNKMKVRLATQA